ncbi:efflux RND transporter periplasmic adaptor subunit [Flavobacteriaceae bacterium F89]|uniref:Efflux RND transporter periplasmic adaptor subunit n=1 Tax=Cerina litoralis TaxID=2874477 RepID=A0AAE3EUJ1_9FLAO|nr:efflux RND transporter periplasmic adaptor subunit [Cerina litoralis]MCG2460001.1 efflux RND transporter periplasmic adaptor subunit [Cerina litoralis]
MQNLIYRIFILFISLTAVGCGNGKKETTETTTATDGLVKVTQAQFDQVGMELGTIQSKEFPSIVNAAGVIDVPPENRAVVSATMGGYIRTLPLLIGDVVKKGQVLLRIENPEFVTLQQDYMEVKGQLDYLTSEYDRQKTMYEEKITSLKSFLKAESEYKTARAKYNGLKKQLVMLHISPENVEAGNVTSTTTIYSPISGSITRVNVTKGSYVAPATPILEIIDNDHIHIELSVFEKDIMKIQKGQHIDFNIPEASSDTFKANVYLVGTAIGEGRTIKVHGHLKDEDNHNFLTGMFVEASIVTNTAFARALPNEAIVNIDNKDYVLVLDKEEGGDYYFREIVVKTSDSYRGYTLIENGAVFKPTDQFLTKGAFDLLGE